MSQIRSGARSTLTTPLKVAGCHGQVETARTRSRMRLVPSIAPFRAAISSSSDRSTRAWNSLVRRSRQAPMRASVRSRSSAMSLGLADASVVVLAARYGVRDLLTLDERRFRAIRGPGSRPFRILPADA